MLFNVIRNLIAGYPVDFLTVVAQVLSVLFVIFAILPLHEFAHAWVATKLGDPTPKWDGRLTLNPLVSIDPMGAGMLLLFGFGWAKPVQVNARNFKKPKRDMAITALAGPVSNLLAALVGAIILTAVAVFAPYNTVVLFIYNVLYYYVIVNVTLAVFNLLPIPPLDGSRILGAFLSDRALYNYYRYQQYFIIGLYVLMFTGALSGPLGWLQSLFGNAIFWVAELPFKLFGVL